VIAVAYPKDGISVDSESVHLYGVAEHEKGILKLEIFLNNQGEVEDAFWQVVELRGLSGSAWEDRPRRCRG
jgi:coenzyme F420-reducing hydrogenase alpha subunit